MVSKKEAWSSAWQAVEDAGVQVLEGVWKPVDKKTGFNWGKETAACFRKLEKSGKLTVRQIQALAHLIDCIAKVVETKQKQD